MASGDRKSSKASSSRAGRIRTLSDLNRPSAYSDSDSDWPQEYYTGGEKRSQYQEESVQGLYRRHKKVKLAKECAKEDRCPPPGKPLSSRVPFELVGDVFQLGSSYADFMKFWA
ncbi:hypothetical protein K1719_027292 [Acacia pycnantha]|nr:hypothetical protein K1719_046473 [Acacia pycnantha]KAI9093278.1 hypothetical protein K1719_027292 [Acacia pycnantha]